MQVLSHHCYSPNIARADFVLFPTVKDHLDVITLTQDTLKSTWERAIRTVSTKEFAAAYTVRNGHGNLDLYGKFAKNQLCSFVHSMGKKDP
jgi:hypothetical protein